MIRLNVFIQVGAEKRQEVVALSKELVAASLKDNGCVAYDLFESATRPDVLMICETYGVMQNLFLPMNRLLTSQHWFRRFRSWLQ